LKEGQIERKNKDVPNFDCLERLIQTKKKKKKNKRKEKGKIVTLFYSALLQLFSSSGLDFGKEEN